MDNFELHAIEGFSCIYLSYLSVEAIIDKVKSKNFVRLYITNFPSSQNAMDLLMCTKFQEIFNYCHNAIAITLIYDERYNYFSYETLDLLEQKYSKTEKSILISFQSNSDKKFSIQWRLGGRKKMLMLEVAGNHDEYLSEVKDFTEIFLLISLHRGETGIIPGFDPDNLPDTFLNFNHLSDLKNRTILMIAAETGNLQVVKFLIKFGLKVLCNVDGKYAIDFAFEGQHNDIMLELLKFNSTFPKNFNPTHASNELKNFFNLMELMHESVERDDSETISEIISENPNLRYFFNLDNETAIDCALKKVKCKAYEVLMLNHLDYGSADIYVSIIENLTEEEREKIRQINFKHTRRFGEKHIIALMGCSTIVNSEKKSELLNYVLKAFNTINEIPKVAKILELSSLYKNLEIVFDFNNEILQFLDPTAGAFDTASFYYRNGKIAIAAKKLLDPETEHIVIGALAHELCHLAIFMAFRNMAKPYHANDSKALEKFNEILKFCDKNKINEPIIEWVFGYEEELQHIELAVRVVHILAHYHKEPEKIQENVANFKPLFDNFDEKIHPKVEEEIFNLEGRIRKKFTLLKGIIILLLVLLPIGILSGVLLAYNPNYKWSKLSNEQKIKFQNAPVNFYGFNVKFKDLFANYSEVYEELPSEHIRYGLEENSLKLSKVINSTYKQKIYLKFSNMTESLQKGFLSQNLNFQGKEVKIKEILTNFSVLNHLSAFEIRKIFDGRPINISSEIKAQIQFFIERFFIEEKIEIKIWKHYKNDEINEDDPEVKNLTAILSTVETTKIFILSSPAGEGKSEIFRYIAFKMKESNPNNWIQFVDLKKHSEAFKSGSKENLKLKKIFLNFFTLNLLNLNDLESEIFRELFKLGRVTFLWDGIDEISPLYKDFMFDLTSTIKSSSNCSQFISTRPQFSKDFQVKFSHIAHKLMSVGKQSRIKYLTKTFAKKFNVHNLGNVTKNLEKIVLSRNMSKLYRENEKFFNALQESEKLLDSIDRTKNLVTNPLLLRMISEILSDESFERNSRLNIYLFYDKFIDKKLEIVRKEKGEIVGADLDKIQKGSATQMQVHQAYALKLIFGEFKLENHEEILIPISNLSIMSSMSKLSAYQISRFGILEVFSDSDFNFIHRTFAEFLVARFFIDNFEDFDLLRAEYDSNIKLFALNSVLYSIKQFEYVKKFILCYAGNENENPKFFQVLRQNEKYYDHLKNFSSYQIFKELARRYTSSAKLPVFSHLNELKNEVDKFFMQTQDLKDELLGRANNGITLLSEVLDHEDYLKPLLETMQRVLTKNEISNLIFARKVNFNTTSLIDASWKLSLKYMIAFWNFLDKNLDENKKREILVAQQKNLLTALQYSATNKDPNSFLYCVKIYEKFLSREEIEKILLTFKKQYRPFVNDVISDASLETAIEVANYLKQLFKNKIVELRNFLNHRDSNLNSIFSWYKDKLEFKENLRIFESLMETPDDEQIEASGAHFGGLKVFLNVSEDLSKLNPNATWSHGDFEFFISFFDRTENKSDNKILKKVLLSTNERNESLLVQTILYPWNKVFLKPLLQRIPKALNNTELMSLLCVHDKKALETVFMYVARWFELKDLKVFWKFLEENLSEKEQKKVLLDEQKRSTKPLQYSTWNKDPNSFLFVKEIYEKFFTQEEIRFFFTNLNENFVHFICAAIEDGTLETLQEVRKYLENLLGKMTLRKLFSLRHTDGVTIINYIKDKNLFGVNYKFFMEFFKATFEESQMEEFEKIVAELEQK